MLLASLLKMRWILDVSLFIAILFIRAKSVTCKKRTILVCAYISFFICILEDLKFGQIGKN